MTKSQFKVGDLVVCTGLTHPTPMSGTWDVACANGCIDPTKPLKVKDVWSTGRISLEGVSGAWEPRFFCLHLNTEPEQPKVGDLVTRKETINNRWNLKCESAGVSPHAPHRVTEVNLTDCTLTLRGLGDGWFWDNFTKVVKTGRDGEGPNPVSPPEGTYTGGSSDYYTLTIDSCTTEGRPSYIVECNDIIEKLGMNYAEGNAFKALWRRAAQRTLGLRKKGSKDDGLYDAEKVEFFGKRLVEQSKAIAK